MNNDNHEKVRLTVVVNKRLEPGVAMNAVFHLGAGIANLVGEEGRQQLKFLDFRDNEGEIHPSISARSFIVLRAKSGEIRKLRRQAREVGILFCDFVDTMTGDTYHEQLEKTCQTKEEDLEFFGIALFGEKEVLAPLTGNFSLWR